MAGHRVKSVIAWRQMVLTLLGQKVPEQEAEVLFTAPELDFLHDYTREYGEEILPNCSYGRSG